MCLKEPDKSHTPTESHTADFCGDAPFRDHVKSTLLQAMKAQLQTLYGRTTPQMICRTKLCTYLRRKHEEEGCPQGQVSQQRKDLRPTAEEGQ